MFSCDVSSSLIIRDVGIPEFHKIYSQGIFKGIYYF
jgi:hypothetical protein